MSTSSFAARLEVQKDFSSSILLWVRSDQPREIGMAYWKRPHSGIIAATPGLSEYRQLHLAEQNPGLWPVTDGVETSIPVGRKIDGVAEVTLRSVLSPLQGRKQTRLAYKDEVNVFRRTLLYGGLLNSSRWYDVAPPGTTVGARAGLSRSSLGFADVASRDAFFKSPEAAELSDALAPFAAAVHAYEVSEALTFVKDGVILPQYQQ